MDRDECLTAIDEVFDAYVEAHIDTWDIHVKSDPPRNIVLSKAFVAANITADGLSREDFVDLLRKTPTGAWHKRGNGTLFLLLT